MNKDQFIYWLKGFTKAVNEEGPTRGQWGIIASELSKIEDCPNFGSPIESPVPLPKYQQPRYIDQHIITCTTGSSSSGITIIATPGYGSITYNPSTSTAYVNPQSGSWHYTDALDRYKNWYYTSTSPNQPTTGSNQLELDLK
jgi:hypothetical protein